MPFSGYLINRRLAFTQFVTAGGQPSFESHINKQYVLGVEVSSTAVLGYICVEAVIIFLKLEYKQALCSNGALVLIFLPIFDHITEMFFSPYIGS